MPLSINNEIFFSVPEAAAEIGRANQTVYQNWKSWGWSSYRFGSTLLFSKSEIHQWLSEQIKKELIK